ncbi:cytochrome c oxidase subunit II [Salarchaeum sp. JOR-1]|uniref:cytochrome c oxidase subunit II n=1 Tax=Salarchaeum sp. JOR-1 TaxID=2599399 RepID=UPI0011984821|nr:cytochrome c oxidase subunit II [Salarchaeum sp. JOR-1]QDX39653.1 cytochrome c oxidase subunit II [Salarchaeum sp. JOR-1]
MRGKRLVSRTVAGLGLLALAVAPAAAAPSNSLDAITSVGNVLLAAALPITILVEAALFYTVWKFRKSDEPKPTKENRRLEITWTAATAVVLLFVGIAAYGGLAAPGVTTTGDTVNETMAEENPVVVDVIAYQWGWRFEYPVDNETVTVNGTEQTLTNFTVSSQMVLPDDRTVVLRLHSEDVVHAVHVPDLGLKQDVMPSRVNVLQTTLTDAERDRPYVLYCAEFCGAAHSQMLGSVKVVSQSEYEQFLAANGATNTTANASA